MIMLGEELPSLPPLMARHWFFIIQIFEQLSCPEKQSCPETFHCVEIFFLSALLSNLCLPWKTECALNSLYWIYIYILIIQNFEQFALALKNRVCPEIFHCIEIFFIFQDFWGTCACPENRVCHEIFTVFNILFTFRMFEQLLLAMKNRVCPELTVVFHHSDFWTTCACSEKQSLPWIHCIKFIFFLIQNFEQPALALKNRICPEIFHCIEIFFTFQDFWATWACPENRVCPEFFKPGGRPPPPRLVCHWSQIEWGISTTLHSWYYMAGLHNIWPTKAFLAAHENFFNCRKCWKTRPRISYCCSIISSILQRNLYIEMKDFCGPRQN